MIAVGHQLTALDELLEQVRDAGSRLLIEEALASYRAGALRLSIIGVWNAVYGDVIAKFRELAEEGNSDAAAAKDEFDRNLGNKQWMQKHEGRALDQALALGIINHRELDLLARIRGDRNSCAHPALTSEADFFSPTPEQVRAHIVNAVEILLKHRPVQGKEALRRIWRDLGPALPADWSAAVALLHNRYLRRAQPALLRSLARAAAVGVLYPNNPFQLEASPEDDVFDARQKRRGLLACLEAVERTDKTVVDAVLRRTMDEIEKRLGDSEKNSIPLVLCLETRIVAKIKCGNAIRDVDLSSKSR